MINTTDVTSGTGIANPSEAPEFTPVYFGGFIGGVCVGQSLVFCLVFCRLLVVLFSFDIVLSVL